MPTKPKIITSDWCMPGGQFSWMAYREDEEEKGGYGYGATPEEAIADLLMNEGDEDAEV